MKKLNLNILYKMIKNDFEELQEDIRHNAISDIIAVDKYNLKTALEIYLESGGKRNISKFERGV